MSGQFYLFAGSQFYAAGGANDFIATFPTVDNAVRYVADQQARVGWDWWHVTNDSMQMVEVGVDSRGWV